VKIIVWLRANGFLSENNSLADGILCEKDGRADGISFSKAKGGLRFASPPSLTPRA